MYNNNNNYWNYGYSDSDSDSDNNNEQDATSLKKLIDEGYTFKAQAQKLKQETRDLNGEAYHFKLVECKQAYKNAISKFNQAIESNDFIYEARFKLPSDITQSAFYGIAFCQFQLALKERLKIKGNKENHVRTEYINNAILNLEAIIEPTTAHLVLLAQCHDEVSDNKVISTIKTAAKSFNRHADYLRVRNSEQCEILKNIIDKLCVKYDIENLTNPAPKKSEDGWQLIGNSNQRHMHVPISPSSHISSPSAKMYLPSGSLNSKTKPTEFLSNRFAALSLDSQLNPNRKKSNCL